MGILIDTGAFIRWERDDGKAKHLRIQLMEVNCLAVRSRVPRPQMAMTPV